ncbi:MAG: hypothetical protein F6K19_23540 [Cyanothece sp. SIO1E1]|nr:hypothetical protein [Cyanothece sp. SIO1E1]
MSDKVIVGCLLFICLSCSRATEDSTENQATDSFSINGLVEETPSFSKERLLELDQQDLGTVQLRKGDGEVYLELEETKGVLLKDVLGSVPVKGQTNKNYSAYYVDCKAVDGFQSVYSWNELFNSPTGNSVYLITEANGKSLDQMSQSIMMVSLQDQITGKRNLRNLSSIEVSRVY